MRTLLDECIPRKLANEFADHHERRTVPEVGLAGKNGALLSLAEAAGFEIFLTMDKGLQYEQNLTGRNIAILVIRAKSNRLADLLPLVPSCRSIMNSIEQGQVIRVGE